jgi:glutamate carboxypeptidase
MTQRGQEITDYIFSNKNNFISLLRSLVEEETPSDVPSSFDNIFQKLRTQFEQLDFKVEYVEGDDTAGHLLVKPDAIEVSNPTQLIVGHCDTVWPINTLEEMPFKVEEDIISGPGVYDMKTGLCMMIWALRTIIDLNKDMSVQPVFLITSDEEIGSHDSQPLLIEWAKRAERTFVLEPSLGIDGKIKTQRKGVGNFEISITGKPSHAGLAPEQGVSAILALSQIVQKLFQLNDPSRGISINVGTIEGGERSNVIAAKSKAIVDVRVLTKKDGEQITDKLYNLESEMEGIDIDVKGNINRPPMEKNQANRELWDIAQSLGHELDLELREGISGGASDGNLTNPYSPTLDGLGAVGEGAHAWHEKIFLEETLERTALLSLLMLEPPFKV